VATPYAGLRTTGTGAAQANSQVMGTGFAWAAHIVFGLCLVGLVAWPLWSDSMVWVVPFSLVAIVVMVPVVVLPGLRALRDVMKGADE
jgi:hypothetical protein